MVEYAPDTDTRELQKIVPSRRSRHPIRARCIRLTGRILQRVARMPGGRELLRAIRGNPLGSKLLNAALGYHRLFASVAEAERCARRYFPETRSHASTLSNEAYYSHETRLSDYPVLFYLAELVQVEKRLFDLGGNIGNLYYCYRRHVQLPEGFEWIVHDLPATIEIGRQCAQQNSVNGQLTFSEDFGAAEGAGIFLASGCLHYFDASLPDMLRRLKHRPRHVLINRAALTEGSTVVSIQDTPIATLGCKLHNVNELGDEMKSMGYRIVDHWQVDGMRLILPLYPDHSAHYYSGFYFRLESTAEARP